MKIFEIISEKYTGPLSDKQKELLKKGYKLDKDGDDIIPGSSDFFDKARKDPNSSYKANTTTDFKGGGYKQTFAPVIKKGKLIKPEKVVNFPNVNAKVSTTTQKKKGGKLKTDVKFKGNL